MYSVPTCPRCGRHMTIPDVAILHWQNAPWVCTPCQAGFWNAELTDEARAIYRVEYWDFGSLGHIIAARVDQEVMAAKARRTSVGPEISRHLNEKQLALWTAKVGAVSNGN